MESILVALNKAQKQLVFPSLYVSWYRISGSVQRRVKQAYTAKKEGIYIMYPELPIIFINCSVFPFISWIISGLKRYETRENRNTLKQYIGQRVYLCETGKKEKVIRCIVTIAAVYPICSKKEYSRLRKFTRVKKGSCYDWTSRTRVKYLYELTEIVSIDPFVPMEGKRPGYTSMDFNGIERKV